MAPPGFDDISKARRLHLAVRGILRNCHPGLRAPRPDMSNGKEPARVIETARLHDGDLGICSRLVKKPAAAICAYDAIDHPAALVVPFPYGRLTLIDDDRAPVGKQRKAECAARLPLTFGAMARVDGKRRRRNLIGHAFALAATG